MENKNGPSNFRSGTQLLRRYRILAAKLWKKVGRMHRSPPFLWSDLATFGRMRSLQAMSIWLFVVPIMVKATEQVDQPIMIFGAKFIIELPFSWYIFYFAAVFFTLANIIYQLRCPGLIRHYYNFRTYRDSGQSYHYLVDYLRHEEMVDIATRTTRNVSRLVNYAGWQSGQSSSLLGTTAWDDDEIPLGEYVSSASLQETDEKELFFYLHRMLQDYHPYSRQACLAFYMFGGVGIVWVFGEAFFFVVRSLL